MTNPEETIVQFIKENRKKILWISRADSNPENLIEVEELVRKAKERFPEFKEVSDKIIWEIIWENYINLRYKYDSMSPKVRESNF